MVWAQGAPAAFVAAKRAQCRLHVSWCGFSFYKPVILVSGKAREGAVGAVRAEREGVGAPAWSLSSAVTPLIEDSYHTATCIAVGGKYRAHRLADQRTSMLNARRLPATLETATHRHKKPDF